MLLLGVHTVQGAAAIRPGSACRPGRPRHCASRHRDPRRARGPRASGHLHPPLVRREPGAVDGRCRDLPRPRPRPHHRSAGGHAHRRRRLDQRAHRTPGRGRGHRVRPVRAPDRRPAPGRAVDQQRRHECRDRARQPRHHRRGRRRCRDGDGLRRLRHEGHRDLAAWPARRHGTVRRRARPDVPARAWRHRAGRHQDDEGRPLGGRRRRCRDRRRRRDRGRGGAGRDRRGRTERRSRTHRGALTSRRPTTRPCRRSPSPNPKSPPSG